MQIWNQLTYRQKNIYGGILFLIMVLVVYNYNISPTLDLLQENNRLSANIKRAKGASQRLVNMKSKGVRLNKRLVNYMSDTLSDQQLLLKVVGQYCDDHHMKLRNFPATRTEVTEDFTLRTNEIIVEGTFSDLLQLMYLLETKYPVGRLASAEFEKVRDKKIRKDVLLLKMHFQKIKVNDENS